MTTVLLAAAFIVPWFFLGLLGWLGLQLVHQNGRFLLRLEGVEARLKEIAERPVVGAGVPLEAAPQGLAVGTPAPTFELPDVSGKTRSLAEFRGHKIVLIFFGPQCDYCLQMLSKLASVSADGGGPLPLVISSGTVAENRRLFREYGVKCPVLVQSEGEISAAYQAYGTPVGYLIDEQGVVASAMVSGADALLELLDAPGESGVQENGHGRTNGLESKLRPLSRSKLLREGLQAGTLAPEFRLPQIGGGEVALSDFRGRRVLLVFSDPQCGPCDTLVSQLEGLHRRMTDPQVVMVSRRAMDVNRKKVAEAGLTFPVVVQKNWDTSKDYGMFATPIGYLIDAAGVIASDVAVGPEAILSLAGPVGDLATTNAPADQVGSSHATLSSLPDVGRPNGRAATAPGLPVRP